MAILVVEEHVFRAAARVTCGFLMLFTAVLLWQGLTRVKRVKTAVAKKESYERAKDKAMYPIDRSVGNLLEWSPIFLGFFWVSMILTDGATETAGWVYVAARALYPFMAVNKGIGTIGAKAPILVATVPAYIALIVIATPVVKSLFW